ncbi:glycosyltransferase [Rubidibacter lacunae KORDI 51-2]|uniref:Glycosyltransferase n=1 Tax=Rubidibacter lacunae KORDI 51-2 TaxID=582515 RepID=U5DF72_9CHRO|nr:glycosyltransferase [Rubidibacter lacunae]ERN40256.1 glycosyltransferase [Rubidibacter lacunae KORDI 51-2]
MTKTHALVHEWLTPLATGGSELVVKEILQFIDADLYALIDFESRNANSHLYGRAIGTTFLQHFPFARHGIQKYLPLLPLAIEQLDLRAYDTILTSSHAVAKGVLSAPHQTHVCYCHTPMRYAWDLTFDYLAASRAGRGLPGILTRYLLHQLRQWDAISAHRVDYFIANSHHTARRIWRCYRREAEVVYPPVQLSRFQYREQKDDFYLIVSRLVSYKQVPLVVETFNRIQRPLVVIGGGPQLDALRRLAQSPVRVLGPQPDAVVADYMSRAKAFVYAACEDFGIALVEAQACGTPAIAYGRGGAAETVCDRAAVADGATGILFPEQTSEALEAAVRSFEAYAGEFAPDVARSRAEMFAPSVFKKQYMEHLARWGAL